MSLYNNEHRLFGSRSPAEENLHTFVKPSEYMDELSAHSLIRITAVANVHETGQLWSQDDDFAVHKPQLTVRLNSEPRVNVPCEATFSFNNPLPVALTDCTFSVEAPAIHRVIKFRDVLANEKHVTHTEKFTPEKGGQRTVTVSFNSKQLADIKNTITATVLQ